MTNKICLASIIVDDLPSATDFYINKLGFEARDTPHPPNVLPLISDGVPLVLIQIDGVKKQDASHSMVSLAIETDDIGARMQQLMNKGVKFNTAEPERFAVGLRAECNDPSGNILALIEWD
jgi:predicted enzyme related to lactoylglutathione lyase